MQGSFAPATAAYFASGQVQFLNLVVAVPVVQRHGYGPDSVKTVWRLRSCRAWTCLLRPSLCNDRCPVSCGHSAVAVLGQACWLPVVMQRQVPRFLADIPQVQFLDKIVDVRVSVHVWMLKLRSRRSCSSWTWWSRTVVQVIDKAWRPCDHASTGSRAIRSLLWICRLVFFCVLRHFSDSSSRS